MTQDPRIPEAEKPKAERRCPICGKPATETATPFCSKRCADVDLHRWLGGAYAVPAGDSDDELLPDEE
ncbi:MAG: DNA gyrase inhibitor YacG [Beijerinckiaceae bacterium]|nr:DNA gyrase inhibitor YacG [Beijerinckiaceae bacterium]